jgi:transglutaminase/protease-like cytokinesis protein 3
MKYIFLLFICSCLFGYGQRNDFQQIDFKKADSIAMQFKGESLRNLPVLTHKLTANLVTDVEKFRSIYTWVSTNIENDYASYLKTKKFRSKFSKDREAFLEWNSNYVPKVFKNLVANKKTACTGYAYLIREMAILANIECEIVDGYGRTATVSLSKDSQPNHSWNAVKLNNTWYLCDATWSAGLVVLENNRPTFKSDYFDGYFLGAPELFIKNHYPLQSKWSLLKNTPTFTEFVSGPLVYKEAFNWNITTLAPKEMHFETLKNNPITFNLMIPNNASIVHLNLTLNSKATKENVRIDRNSTGESCTIAYTFQRPGLYDVHLRVNEDIIATYVVKVKRK